jgi:hypothetical protein
MNMSEAAKTAVINLIMRRLAAVISRLCVYNVADKLSKRPKFAIMMILMH